MVEQFTILPSNADKEQIGEIIMPPNGFNPFDLVEDLKKSGFQQKQAETLAKMLSNMEAQSAVTKQDLEATKLELKRDIAELKRDIETVKADLKKDIESVKADLKRDIRELESRITFKMAIHSGGIIVTLLTCMVTLAKLGLLTPTP